MGWRIKDNPTKKGMTRDPLETNNFCNWEIGSLYNVYEISYTTENHTSSKRKFLN